MAEQVGAKNLCSARSAKENSRPTSRHTENPVCLYRDVAPELERLRAKAVGKCYDFLMGRIYALKKPKTNIQILQQNVLLKYKYLVTFLRQHGKEVFPQIKHAYVDTLSRVLSSHFRAYLTAVDKLQVRQTGAQHNLYKFCEPRRSGGGGLYGGDEKAKVQF